jgi:hypothetical protein
MVTNAQVREYKYKVGAYKYEVREYKYKVGAYKYMLREYIK